MCGEGKTRLSSATRRSLSTPRPETSRSGIIAARHQRILSARKARRQSASEEGEPRPSTASVRRPTTAFSRPTTAVARPGSSVRRLPTLVSSSADSVTFESERSRMQTFTERQSRTSPPSSPVTSPGTVAAPAKTVLLTIDENDDDDDYHKVRHIGTTSWVDLTEWNLSLLLYSRHLSEQESWAIAKTTARCAQ